MGQMTENEDYGRAMEDYETATDVISEKYGLGEHFVRTRSGRLLRMRNTRTRLHERSRQKRQVLQDMARPLKQWLIRHRNNPYPTKSEKVALALGSQMTLVQVSNWFANARRRLKNTVRDPDMTWSQRIRLYNSYVSGNAEPLSISSDDSVWDSGDENSCVTECPQYHTQLDEHSYSAAEPTQQSENNSRKRKSSESDDQQPPKKIKLWIHEEEEGTTKETAPAKYKTTIIQRYLNDSFKQLERKMEKEKLKSQSEEKKNGFGKGRQEQEANWSELDAAEALTSLAGTKKVSSAQQQK